MLSKFHVVNYNESGLVLILPLILSVHVLHQTSILLHALIKVKRTLHASTVSYSLSNPHKLWQTVNRLLHREPPDAVPDSASFQSVKLLPAFSHLRFKRFILISSQI